MPHRFTADHRDRIPKQKQRVSNWPEYNESLRQRGDLTVWTGEDALALWAAPSRTTRGGQPVYSDLAIEACLTVGMVVRQPLRQTEGLMRSIAALSGIDIAVPDFSTLSRRGRGPSLSAKSVSRDTKPVQLVVDSTGLKISGEGEWQEAKPKTRRKRRSRRKLHPGLDLVSGDIVCSGLTTNDVGDPTALPEMPDRIDGPVELFSGDGAYDGEPTSDALTERFGSTIEVTIPPPGNAVPSPNAAQYPTVRDRHIADIRRYGRMAWQKSSGCNQRSRAETLMGRWKTVIGPKLKARAFENQKTGAGIGVRVLNRMTGPGRPGLQRTA